MSDYVLLSFSYHNNEKVFIKRVISFLIRLFLNTIRLYLLCRIFCNYTGSASQIQPFIDDTSNFESVDDFSL